MELKKEKAGIGNKVSSDYWDCAYTTV